MANDNKMKARLSLHFIMLCAIADIALSSIIAFQPAIFAQLLRSCHTDSVYIVELILIIALSYEYTQYSVHKAFHDFTSFILHYSVIQPASSSAAFFLVIVIFLLY